MCTQHQELDNSFSKSLLTNAPNTTTQLQCPPTVLNFELIPETRKTTKKQRENTHNLARSTYQIDVDFAEFLDERAFGMQHYNMEEVLNAMWGPNFGRIPLGRFWMKLAKQGS
ncbi:uncharacterized protein LOC127126627 [Lathyrus oleraceus]|uniref:uncharacterized protein LOC127126627 n=1 Tax=Pisum sativum TaxID=3888 RepID=UPI0021D03F7E|nr:uncharacterized protein LOC127126627 [Pisum sativum]